MTEEQKCFYSPPTGNVCANSPTVYMKRPLINVLYVT